MNTSYSCLQNNIDRIFKLKKAVRSRSVSRLLHEKELIVVHEDVNVDLMSTGVKAGENMIDEGEETDLGTAFAT